MRVCAVSFKECWQDESGHWYSTGGFPRQMEAIASLFDEMTLLIVRGRKRPGGIRLPSSATVLPLRRPWGRDSARKLFIAAALPYYAVSIAWQTYHCDVVHVPLPGDIPLLAMAIASLQRRPVLARYGGSWFYNQRTSLMNRVTRQSMRRLARSNHVMLATGEDERPPAADMHWIFATALTHDELEGIETELQRGFADPARLVYVGRLSPEKGVVVLLDAIRKLRSASNGTRVKLTIIGDGREREKLESAVRDWSLQDHVCFTGQLTRKELSAILAQQDICVQPSLTEGFSKAWIDAMAHGLPVLACEVGAARQVVGEDGCRGWLCRPNDPDELAKMLQRVLTDSNLDWPGMRRRCRQFAQERTIEAWSARIGELCAETWGLSLTHGKLILKQHGFRNTATV